jgi:hypothetical protein
MISTAEKSAFLNETTKDFNIAERAPENDILKRRMAMKGNLPLVFYMDLGPFNSQGKIMETLHFTPNITKAYPKTPWFNGIELWNNTTKYRILKGLHRMNTSDRLLHLVTQIKGGSTKDYYGYYTKTLQAAKYRLDEFDENS